MAEKCPKLSAEIYPKVLAAYSCERQLAWDKLALDWLRQWAMGKYGVLSSLCLELGVHKLEECLDKAAFFFRR